MSFDEQPDSALEESYERYRQLIKMVKTMRNCQKEYFRTRDRDVLIRSKEAEKAVDEQIGKSEGRGRQESLFGEQP